MSQVSKDNYNLCPSPRLGHVIVAILENGGEWTYTYIFVWASLITHLGYYYGRFCQMLKSTCFTGFSHHVLLKELSSITYLLPHMHMCEQGFMLSGLVSIYMYIHILCL